MTTKSWFAGLLSGGLVVASGFGYAGELTIAENGKTDYQIVIPDKGKEGVVDKWLFAAATLMQASFETNGFRIEVVQEGAKTNDKPGIYLGATEFAKKNGIKVEQHDDWTYYQKAVGKDLIIAGNDQKDPNTKLALLGTVKGACDFLREYAGVRFLFMIGDRFNKDGSLKIDTRSIAFIPVKKIAVPEKLDLKKTPMMRASCDRSYETLFNIALNFFPPLSHIVGGMAATAGTSVGWPSATEYATNHPEYFALTKDGERACDLRPHDAYAMAVCVTGKGVQDLMYMQAEKLIASGKKSITIGTIDSYGLSQCNCEECCKLFGMKAENLDQIWARGRSGKLWQAFFKITERIRKKYPDVKITLLNYQDTPISAEIIKKFPKNVIPQIQFASQADFDKLKGVEFPAGICGFKETFTTFGQAGPYLPERTPEHMAEVVQAMARNNVKWSSRDGSMGYVRGLQAPAYYVYGRMMDDPAADWKAIYKEFCAAAFGNVEPQMTGFFDLLHMQIAVYSDFFGVFMPAWNRKYSRSTYHDSKWHVMSMYTPEYCADADALLTSAEKAAKDPDVQARLHLIRIEFDYIRKMSRIFFIQNVWTMKPSQANMDPLVDAIDDWHTYLEKLSGGTNRGAFKPLSDWPEMCPFAGNYYLHAALIDDGYQQQWANTCLNWDEKAIRAGILTDKHQIKVATVEAAPGIDSKSWDTVPESFFKVRNGMPFSNVRTTMKVLRDKDNLYVRVASLWPSIHPEDMIKKETDGNIFTQEYVELGIMPPDSGGKVYRLAANPVEGSRYDSVFTPDKSNRMTEDKTWDGKWEFAVRTSLKKGRYTLGERIWTAWFRIPFTDFGGKAPAAGEVWRFNAARNRIGQYMLWSDAPGVTDTQALGDLISVAGKTLKARTVVSTWNQFDFQPFFGERHDPAAFEKTAYVFVPLKAKAAMEVTLGLGGDYWLQAWVNGESILGETGVEDQQAPPSIGDFKVKVSLKAGMNVLAMRFIAGKASSVLALGGPRELRAGDFRSILSDLFLNDARWARRELRAKPGTKPAVDIGSRRELFIDDFLVDRLTGSAERRLHHPVPREVVLQFGEKGKPWDSNCPACAMKQEGGLIRIYYRGVLPGGLPDVDADLLTCLAESADGIHFTRPELGLYEFNGSKKNNIVSGSYRDPHYTSFLDSNPDAPEDQRFKAIYVPLGGAGLHVFGSPDGIRWRALADKPFITVSQSHGGFDGQNDAFWDPLRKLYVCFFRER